MVGKLLKHEFRATARSMLLVYAALAATAVLANLSIRLMDVTDNQFLRFLFILILITFMIGVVAAVVITAVVMIDRFYRSLLKDQGYLMHTLPVTAHGHIWSKLIVSFVWFAATFLVIFLLIMATALIQSGTDLGSLFESFPSWSELMKELQRAGASAGSVFLFMLECLCYTILVCLGLCLHFYAAMAIGHMFSKNQILLSIVFFIVISIVLNMAGTGVGAVVLKNENVFHAESFSELLSLLHIFTGQLLLVQLIRCAALYAATFLPLRFRLNLA